MSRSAAIVPRRPALAAMAVALLGLAASGALGGLPDAVAYLLPPALLLLALVAWRYPGERALLALIERGRPRRRCAAGGGLVAAAGRRAMMPRGGLLIAASLAVRPPPAPRIAPS
jgi:hypothetical protein